MTPANRKRPSILNFRTLRVVAVVLPLTFAVALLIFEEEVLRLILPHALSHAAATFILAVAAVAFSTLLFGMLESAYRQMERQQENERQRAEEWKELFETGREITASPDLQALLNAIVRRARRLLDSDAAFLLLCEDGQKGGLRMAACSGLDLVGRDLVLAMDEAVEGLALETGAPVTIEDHLSDDRIPLGNVTFTAREGLLSQVSVPLAVKGKMLGTLTVANRNPSRFGERQVEILSAFANWAAVAVETSRLYGQLQGVARMEERERIGVELHDAVIQSIYAVQLNLQACSSEVEENPGTLCGCLERANADLDKVVAYMRRYIFGLRPYLDGAADLPRALGDLVQDLKVNTMVHADLRIEGDLDGALDEEQAEGLFLIAQEALTNSVRHIGGGTASIQLLGLPGEVLLQVMDDGAALQDGDAAEKPVLKDIAGRAAGLGAGLSITGHNGHGTCISVRVPVKGNRPE